MNQKKFTKTISFLLFIYCLYCISTFYQSDFYGNILSPIVGFSTFIILFKVAIDVNEDFNRRIVWFLLSFANLTWTVADTIWAFFYFLTTFNPEESSLISFLYSCSNILLFGGVIFFFYETFKKWNSFQLWLDSIYISSSSILLLFFLHNNIKIFPYVIEESLFSIFIFALDILNIVAIAIFYFHLRKGKIPKYILITIIGITIFSIADLYYYQLDLNNSYIPNSIIDSVAMSSFILIAIGVILKKHTTNTESIEIVFPSITVGSNKSRLLLYIFPIFLMLIEGINIIQLINLLVFILTHQILSIYIQASIKNEQLLIRETEMNMLLEEKIKQRTKEITDKNVELEKKNIELDFLSNRDTLTNLYNRRYFINNFINNIDSLNAYENVALIYMDLDRFKTINDMYGHQIGDLALIEISKRLEYLNKENYILARLGGDEFVVVCRGILDYTLIENLSNSIIDKCKEPIEIGEYMFYISTSIGVSLYPFDANDSNTLMKNAGIAMQEAKMQGKNRCIFFDSRFNDNLNRNNIIENLLRKANFDDEFKLVYQPQYSIKNETIIGAEALLRWNNKLIGFISPEEFIPIAEEMDLINSIGDWVMENTIKQISIWNNKSINLKVGINISPKQLDNKNLIVNLKKFMEIYSVSPKYIDIEITENIAIEGEYKIKQIESLFNGLGLSISIDDFGTGYSSLSYLKIFPFERIKIAKPLIDVLATDSFDFQIVKAVIMLAKSLGIKTIAEGVEHQIQFDILEELGCDEIQGYLLGKPMSATKLEEIIISSN
jgi:diguanylate cyclase (GGDEF)-like protein